MMKFRHIAAALMGALAISGQASAATFVESSGAAHSFTDYTVGSSVSFDLDLQQLSAVTLTFSLDADDLAAGQLSFSSLVRNMTALGVDRVYIALNGVSFASAGSITTDGFVNVTSSGSNAGAAWATFGPALTTDFYIGNPLAGTTDWALSLAGRQVGDTFSVTVAAVPEADTYAMVVAGLAVLGLALRRRAA